ncbi:MAG: DUF2309 family protein, partial [Burkholderiales bacterium]|nr:DUF2309 family protein [Burkholderiales bacterium]
MQTMIGRALARESVDPISVKIDRACEAACRAIAPAWPLDRSIAVNPHWFRIGMPIRRVAARMALLGDIHVFPSRRYVKQAWTSAQVGPADLEAALSLHDAGANGLSVASCLDALDKDLGFHCLPLLIDVLDTDPLKDTRLSWRQAITHQVSQTCAAYFDHAQADWRPQGNQSLYAFWLDTIQHDHGIGTLMGLPKLGKQLSNLPRTRQDAEQWVMKRLGLPEDVWADYLEAVLLTINGWASWCAYLRWQAELAGQSDEHIRDLLAIRLAWGVIVLESRDDRETALAFARLQKAWGDAHRQITAAESALRVDEVWQSALDLAYQRRLVQHLAYAEGPSLAPVTYDVQAAFCIDVRSERLRRALEAVWPAVQTMGVAGFFGLPISYAPLGTELKRPQLPGLLAPSVKVTDEIILSASTRQSAGRKADQKVARARRDRLAFATQWQSGTRWPGAAFSLVEAVGLGYLGKLFSWTKPGGQPRANADLTGLPSRYRRLARPTLVGLGTEDKVAIAGKVL